MLDTKHRDSRSTQLVALLMLITLSAKAYILVNGVAFLILLWNWLRHERDDRIFLSPLLSLSWIFLIGFLLISYTSGLNVGYSDLATFSLESLSLVAIPPLFALNRGHLFWEKLPSRSALINGLLLAWVILALAGKLSRIFPGQLPELQSSGLSIILFSLFPFSMVILAADPSRPRRWNYFFLICAGLALVADPIEMTIVGFFWIFNALVYFTRPTRLKVLITGGSALLCWLALRIFWPQLFGSAYIRPDFFSQFSESAQFYTELVGEHPLSGLGPYLSPEFLKLRILESHLGYASANSFNSYLAIAVQSGLAGVVFFLAWLITLLRALRREPKSEIIRRSYFQVIVALMIYALFCDIWSLPEARQVIMIALAWLFSITSRLGEKTESALPAV
jgi:hypothetical protein